jgi:hypothetical protein
MVTPELTAKQVKIAQNTPLLRLCRTYSGPAIRNPEAEMANQSAARRVLLGGCT